MTNQQSNNEQQASSIICSTWNLPAERLLLSRKLFDPIIVKLINPTFAKKKPQIHTRLGFDF